MSLRLMISALAVVCFCAATNAQEVEPILTIDARDGHCRWVEFSPDGKHVATCGDKWVQLFDVTSGELVRQFSGNTKSIDRFSFSPDGELIASAGRDHTIHIWNVQTWEIVKVIKEHAGHVIGVSFSPDGQWLGSTSAGQNDRTVRIWSCDSWREVARADQPLHSNSMYVAFSPDNQTVVASGYKAGVRVYNFDGESLKLRFEKRHLREEMVPHVVFAPDGRSFVTSSWDRTLRRWDVRTGEEIWRVTAPQYAKCFEAAVFTKDGETLYCVTRDETIQKRDTKSGDLLDSFRWNDEVRGIDLFPDETLLATAGHRGKIKIWKAP